MDHHNNEIDPHVDDGNDSELREDSRLWTRTRERYIIVRAAESTLNVIEYVLAAVHAEVLYLQVILTEGFGLDMDDMLRVLTTTYAFFARLRGRTPRPLNQNEDATLSDFIRFVNWYLMPIWLFCRYFSMTPFHLNHPLDIWAFFVVRATYGFLLVLQVLEKCCDSVHEAKVFVFGLAIEYQARSSRLSGEEGGIRRG